MAQIGGQRLLDPRPHLLAEGFADRVGIADVGKCGVTAAILQDSIAPALDRPGTISGG